MPDSVNPKIRGHRISQVMPKATESAWMTASIIRSSPQQTLHGERRLAHVRVGVRSCDEAVRDAMSEMVLQQRHGDLVQRTGDRGDLREDVDAVGVLLNHPLDPADLTLDTAKPNEQPILVVVIANHRDLLGSRRAYPHGVSQPLAVWPGEVMEGAIFTRFRRPETFSDLACGEDLCRPADVPCRPPAPCCVDGCIPCKACERLDLSA